MTIADSYGRILARVAAAAERAGRDPRAVRIIGVTKLVERAAVEEAYRAGVRDFGENRVQDAARKFADPLPADATLHLIGHLQTNKARDAVSLFSVIHSVDRPGVIDALARRAEQRERRLDILLQVNISGEPQKHGCAPDDALGLLRQAVDTGCLRVLGLMTIAPLVDDPEEARLVFRALRQLRDRLRDARSSADLAELSMGMTNDFEVAVEEGATLVRIGRALFSGSE